MGIKELWKSLSWIDKLLTGIGGVIITIVTSVAGVYIAMNTRDVEDSRLWKMFVTGVTVFEKFWQPVDAIIKGKNKNPYVEKFRYAIDQGLDILDGIVDGPEMAKLFPR